MLKKILYLSIFSFLGFTFFSSCANTPSKVETTEYVQQIGDIVVNVRYLNRGYLLAEHGDDGNPYIDFPSMLSKDDLICFELEVYSEETSIEIERSSITLKIGEVTEGSIEKFGLTFLWQSYFDEGEMTEMDSIVDQTMKRGPFKVSPGNPLLTYLVFNGRYPEAGEALLSLPAITDLGDQGVIEIPFIFVSSELKSDSDLDFDENGKIKQTGIFSE